MLIEALKKVNTTSHSLKKGDVVDMRSVDAQKLIDKKEAKKVATKKTAKKA